MANEFYLPGIAQYQSSYVPLPIERYDDTLSTLQKRYQQTQAAEDKLYSYLNNLNVHDEDKEVVTNTIANINGELQNINGRYESFEANNIIRKIARDLDANEELKAAVKDKSAYDTILSDLQKASLDPKSGITNEAVQAFATITKSSKVGAVKKDENGIIQNRMTIAPPPIKIDTTEKVMELAEQLAKNPDVVETLHPGMVKGVAEYYNMDSKKVTTLSKDKLEAAITSWIKNTPEVRAYYDYINTAHVIRKFGNEPVPLENLLSDFGLQLDIKENTKEIGAYSLLKNPKTGKVEKVNTNLSSIANYFIEESLDENGQLDPAKYDQLSKNMYVNLKTAYDLGNITDFAKVFAFNKVEHTNQFLANKQWEENQENKRQQRQINGAFELPGAILKGDDFDIKKQELNIGNSKNNYNTAKQEFDRLKELSKSDPEIGDSNEYLQAKQNYDLAKNRLDKDRLIYTNIATSALNDPLIKNNIDKEYNEILNEHLSSIPKNKQDKFKQLFPTKQHVYDWLTQKNDLPISLITMDAGSGNKIVSDVNKSLGLLKDNFQNQAEKKVKRDGIKGTYGTAMLFTEEDKEGKTVESNIHNFLGNYILNNSSVFTVSKLAGREDAVKLDQLLMDEGINLNKYTVSAQPIGAYGFATGAYNVILTPKDESKKDIIQLQVETDPTMTRENAMQVSQLILSNTVSPKAINWAIDEMAYVAYGEQFDDLEHTEYAIKDVPESTILNVPIRTTKGVATGHGVVKIKDNEYVFYPYIDYKNNILGDSYASGKTIRELRQNLVRQTYYNN